MQLQLKEESEGLGVEIIFSHETEPFGMDDPFALARDFLTSCDEPIFVLDSDIILCEFPFRELEAFHRNHGREGTIVVTKVEKPSKYGVFLYNETGCIHDFVQKPYEFISNKINANNVE